MLKELLLIISKYGTIVNVFTHHMDTVHRVKYEKHSTGKPLPNPAKSCRSPYVMRRDRNRRATELSEHQIDAATRTRHSHLVLTNERLRIADELRTVLTRSIDTIACHAETGCRLVDTDTNATRDALRSISTISRDALNDLRRLLKHLRDTTDSLSYLPIPSTLETVGRNTTGVTQ